jgi:hypothetical protein
MSATAIGDIVSEKWGDDAKKKLQYAQEQQKYIARWMRALSSVMPDGMHRDVEIIGAGGKDNDELLISFSNQGNLFTWSRDSSLRDNCHAALSNDTKWFFGRFVKLTAQMRMPSVTPAVQAAKEPTEKEPETGHAKPCPYTKFIPSPKKQLTPERLTAGEKGIAAMRDALKK